MVGLSGGVLAGRVGMIMIETDRWRHKKRVRWGCMGSLASIDRVCWWILIGCVG